MKVYIDIRTWYPVFIIYKEKHGFLSNGKEIEVTREEYDECKKIEEDFNNMQGWIKQKAEW